MMRFIPRRLSAWAFACVLSVLMGSVAAQDKALRVIKPERRLALVIGNQAYRGSWALSNPVKDAKTVETVLKDALRFEEVVMLTDIKTDSEMKVEVEKFGRQLRPNDLAFFYYSGHGIQIDGRNYLLPTQFDSQTEESFVPHRTLPQEEVMTALKAARLSVLVLDACRNNPYKKGGQGWAHEQAKAERGKGILIAYATAEGDTASDRGFYAEHLVETLKTPGLELQVLFQQVKERVNKLTGGDQRPQHYLDVIGEYYFVPADQSGLAGAIGVASTDDPQPSPSMTPAATAADRWAEIEGTEDVEALSGFVQAYASMAGAGDLVGQARARLEALLPAEWTNSLGMEFVWVPAGEFLMRAECGDAEDDEKLVTRERINRGFYLGKYEVTHEQWEAVMKYNASYFRTCGPDCPVENVSWQDVQEYLEKLNEREGAAKYRLPTDAEWVYAAQAEEVAETGDVYDIEPEQAACNFCSVTLAGEHASYLVGTVADVPDKSVIPGVEVSLERQADYRTQVTVADYRGVYVFESLEPGSYEITAKLPGFEPLRYTSISLRRGTITRVNFGLKAGDSELEYVSGIESSPISPSGSDFVLADIHWSPVRKTNANSLGLHGMDDNVSEWVQDFPSWDDERTNRYVRFLDCLSQVEDEYYRDFGIGFRVVRTATN